MGKWSALKDDVEDVLIFVIQDTVTLALLVAALKIGEVMMGIAFPEQNPFVYAIRGYTWIPFVVLYFGLLLTDLAKFMTRRRRIWS